MNHLSTKINMVFSTCDKYDFTWAPFFKQFQKFWPEFNMPIYLCTDSKTYAFPGYDIRCPMEGNTKRYTWSELLLKTLEYIDSEYIFFMLDDFWLTEPVNHEMVHKVLNYMEQNPKIGFCCLRNETGTLENKKYSVDSEYIDMWYCQKEKKYRITTQAGIWRKDFLIRIIRKHETAWEFETRGSWRSKWYREDVFCLKETAIFYPVGGVLWGGKVYSGYIDLFPKDIIDESIRLCGVRSDRNYPAKKRTLSDYWSIFKSMLPKW